MWPESAPLRPQMLQTDRGSRSALVTATIPPVLRQSISRWTARCARGDVIATTDGLVAYSGIRVGNDQTPDFTPGASYPSLTPEVRARLNAGASRHGAKNAATSEVTRTPLPAAIVSRSGCARA